jgi:hypothetical protein
MQKFIQVRVHGSLRLQIALVAIGIFVLGILSAPLDAQAQGANYSFQYGVDNGSGVYLGAVDTGLQAHLPDNNSSNLAHLWIDGAPPTSQLLIRFDEIVGVAAGQIPPNSYIPLAELVFQVSDVANAGTPNTHDLYQMLQTWDAATITWNNSFGGDGIQNNGVEASSNSLDALPAAAANDTIRLDVTSAVRGWVGGATNDGFIFLPGGTNGLALRTSEDPTSSLRPLLEISACDGQTSFVDVVHSYDPVINGSGEPIVVLRDPQQAIGTPDLPSPGCTASSSPPMECGFVTLGDGGSITLRFTNNVLTGSGDSKNDLWIFEIGADVEDTFVEIGTDGLTWNSVGKVLGSTRGVDLDAFGFDQDDSFTYVRLTDDPNEGNNTGYSVGADIDAVCALTSTPVVVVPSLQPLGTVSLVVLIILGAACGRFWATGSKAS